METKTGNKVMFWSGLFSFSELEVNSGMWHEQTQFQSRFRVDKFKKIQPGLDQDQRAHNNQCDALLTHFGRSTRR